MLWYYPTDAYDVIEPGYDFAAETWPAERSPKFGHQAVNGPAYGGILLSRALVEGCDGRPARYSAEQRSRLYDLGGRRFFDFEGPILGDCGAFGYRDLDAPPYTVESMIDWYQRIGAVYGLSLDHIVGLGDPPTERQRDRYDLSLRLAESFIAAHARLGADFEPIGVAHGWNAGMFAISVHRLQEFGYRRIALGGIAARGPRSVRRILREIEPVREQSTELHLLGKTPPAELMAEFDGLGVAGFDSTSPMLMSVLSERWNYWLADGDALRAFRLPAPDAGGREAHTVLREFDVGDASADDVIAVIARLGGPYALDPLREADYRATLAAAAWRTCPCGPCGEIGIDIAIARGSERHKRRGMHNMSIQSRRITDLRLNPTYWSGRGRTGSEPPHRLIQS